MIYDAVDKSMTIKADALIMRTINNMICETATDANANRYVNVLSLYNTKFNKTLTADKAIFDADFIRFASYMISLYADRLGTISTLFNIGAKARFTSRENLHIVLLSDFAKAADTYLYSSTEHEQFVKLPNAETVPYWQGSGANYSFADVSKIVRKGSSSTDLTVSGVLGVMFDRNALGVSNLSKRVTSNYNAKAEFYNNYYKFDAGYFNDTNENFVVFYVADAAAGV